MPASLANILNNADKSKVPAGYTAIDYSSVLDFFAQARTVTNNAGAAGGGIVSAVEGHAGVHDVTLESQVDAQGFVQDDNLKEVVVNLRPKWAIPLQQEDGSLYFATAGVNSTAEQSGQIDLKGGRACPANVANPEVYKSERFNVGVSLSFNNIVNRYVQRFYPNDRIGTSSFSDGKANLWQMMEQGQLWAEVAVINGTQGKVFHAKVIASEMSQSFNEPNTMFVTSPILGLDEFKEALPTYVNHHGKVCKMGDPGAQFPFSGNGHDFYEGVINNFSGSDIKAMLTSSPRADATATISFEKPLQARVRLWASKETGNNQELPEAFYQHNYGDPKEGVYNVAAAAGSMAVSDVSGQYSSAMTGSIGQRIVTSAINVLGFMTINAYVYSQGIAPHVGTDREGKRCAPCRTIAPLDSWPSTGTAGAVKQAAIAYKNLSCCNEAWGIDCSSYVTWVLMNAGVIPLKKTYGFTSDVLAGGNITLNNGFKLVRVTDGSIQPGDILVNPGRHASIAYSATEQIDFGSTAWLKTLIDKVPSQWRHLNPKNNLRPRPMSTYSVHWRVVQA